MDMIEKAARAICGANGWDPSEPSDADRKAACAVLEAIREPSEKMIEEGVYTDDFQGHLDDDKAAKAVKRIWQAMIDEILKPSQGV